MDKAEFEKVSKAISLAIERVIAKGADDVFRPPIFSQSLESAIIAENADAFRQDATHQTLRFLQAANLQKEKIGPTRRSLVSKDENTFRQVAWLDPFDAVKFLAVALLLSEAIEPHRIAVDRDIIHSHRACRKNADIFDDEYGYDSFRACSARLSKERIGQWKVVTDIANFFDRIGNHTLENHLLNAGADKKYVTLAREMLLFWAGDRRSFGIPVGSDASRIISEAVLLNVDRKLSEASITFIRYVDDFRIFCATKAECLRAVALLTSLLADEGLSLNSRKTSTTEIVDSKEIEEFTNRFVEGEHEKLDLTARVEVKRRTLISGRTAISRFYREPGKEALRKIKAIPKEKIIEIIEISESGNFEENLKLAVKYFIYADQDCVILQKLLLSRLTSIFYISDALVKEAERFSSEKCKEIAEIIYGTVQWQECAYPLQVPILRIAAHSAFREPRFACGIVDQHLQKDAMLFFREAISLGYPCLDRARLRQLAIDVFENVPAFVQRAIYQAVASHQELSDDEKRPLLKNMRQSSDDWFIERLR